MADNDKFIIPPGGTVRVRITDTPSRIEAVPSTFLMEPIIPGFPHMPTLLSWSFLVEHGPTGKKALFDLGIPPD
ncbi:Fc.00g025530.m01.CDS01 [Cosmosporella sp. VM-42]